MQVAITPRALDGLAASDVHDALGDGRDWNVRTVKTFTLSPEVTVWIALTEASEAAGCMDALSFRGKPRQLSHVSRVVKNSVNRAGQVITRTALHPNPPKVSP